MVKIQKYTNKRGLVYIGPLKDGKPHGSGTMTKPNGDKISGKWKEGKLFYKIQNFPLGDKYEGFTNEYGSMNGQGKYISPKGVIYKGNWVKNKRNGKGKITYRNGAVYEGEWKDDKKEGKGKIIFKGKTIRGVWTNNLYLGLFTPKEVYMLCLGNKDWK
tara:strand:+ start:52 stop:528 length:477 start_codon:yes stop_codon:yes gene_type:complete